MLIKLGQDGFVGRDLADSSEKRLFFKKWKELFVKTQQF